jgi:hypothetical protein
MPTPSVGLLCRFRRQAAIVVGVIVAQQENPPLRWVAGGDAIATVEQKARDLLAQVYAYREVSSNLAHDDV